MRRLLRWTFNALTAASLLLYLATAGLWVRSYWANDEFYARRPEASDPGLDHYECYLWSDHGRVDGWIVWSERPETEPIPPWQFGHSNGRPGLIFDFGFRSYREVREGFGLNVRTWCLPAWSLVAAFAVLPTIATFRQVRAVRRRGLTRLGCCPACGYDLRATPERCPECGAVPAAKEAA